MQNHAVHVQRKSTLVTVSGTGLQCNALMLKMLLQATRVCSSCHVLLAGLCFLGQYSEQNFSYRAGSETWLHTGYCCLTIGGPASQQHF